MEKAEEKPTSTRKSIISAVALIGALMLLMYAAPMLTEKLKDWQARESSENVAEPEETEAKPEVPQELVDWLPQVEAQLPKNDDGSSKYQLLHMRLSQDSGQLLLDLKEETKRIDLILTRDKFGRYISENENIPMKLYPK